MMKCQVSVIVPIYNVADWLERCVQSLLTQSLNEIEVILVDDGSNDGSGAMCDAYGKEDRRVVVIHQVNGGLSDARNAGLDVARGEFVAFLDGDDWAEPNMLAEMVDAVTSSAVDVVIAGSIVDVVDADGRWVSTRRLLPGSGVIEAGVPPAAVTDDLINLMGYAWNKLYRRAAIEADHARFTAGLSLVEDMIFNADVLTKVSSVVLLDRAFVHYVQRPRESLGNAFYPDFLNLRLRAADLTGAVLKHWGHEQSDIDALLGRLSLIAFRTLARRSSEQPDSSLREKTSSFRRARQQATPGAHYAVLRGMKRVEFRVLRHAPATIVMLAFVVRNRSSRFGPSR